MLKIDQILLVLCFFFTFNYASTYSEFSSYDQLINTHPQFLTDNFFEDKYSYYYLNIKDISDKLNSRRWRKNKNQTLNTEYGKLRLKTLSNLNESICCGFDVNKRLTSFRKNIKDVASSLNLENWNSSFKSGQSSMKFSNVELLFKEQYKNILIYIIKIDKENIENIDTECECTFTINTN